MPTQHEPAVRGWAGMSTRQKLGSKQAYRMMH